MKLNITHSVFLFDFYFTILCDSFVRYSKEEMAKLAVDSLAHNPVENVHLQVGYR